MSAVTAKPLPFGCNLTFMLRQWSWLLNAPSA